MTAFLVAVLLVTAVVAGMSVSSALLGPKRRLDGDKGLPYETGMVPSPSSLGRISVPYRRLALLFVVFDVDLALLLPWALLRGSLTIEAMVSMTVFVLLIALTLAYLWKRWALECD